MYIGEGTHEDRLRVSAARSPWLSLMIDPAHEAPSAVPFSYARTPHPLLPSIPDAHRTPHDDQGTALPNPSDAQSL